MPVTPQITGGMAAFCARAREAIDAAERILLAGHIFPEADSVGSQAALARHLAARGKRVAVRNPTPVQEPYRFLQALGGIPDAAWSHGTQPLPAHDLIVLLDVSDWDYMGALGGLLQASGVPKIVFDHHQSSPPAGTIGLIDPHASATGEVLYRYFLATGARIDSAMAAALYASILFDTGGFRFRCTRDETLLIAAELIRRGARHRELAAELFENQSWPRIELLTAALQRLSDESDGRLAWTYVTREMFAETRTTAVDADGITDHLMAIRGVELAALFRELEGRGVKVTLRSKGKPAVGPLAEAWGGGGRPTAAGFTLRTTLKGAIADVLPSLRELLTAPGATAAAAAGSEAGLGAGEGEQDGTG
ncbi:MAG: hypothetical protein GF330_11735 [Candidatus Eisenbacteria bacterium]|nr:hypothetical protein [Candidatus Eisenbacteria bacterium]